MGRHSNTPLKRFLLGVPSGKEGQNKLKKYDSVEQADFETEEWCEVYARSLKEAKALYPKVFQDWQEAQQEKLKSVGTQRSPFGIGS